MRSIQIQGALAALALLFCSSLWAQAAFVVTVGDSLTAGDGDNGIGGGYPARLLTQLQTPYPGTTLNNLAISGDTTTDLINKQLASAVSALGSAPVGSLKFALVWVGSNDLFGLYASTTCQDYYETVGECETVEIGLAADNLEQIISELSSAGAAVYVALLDDQSRRPVITNTTLRNDTFPDFTADEIPRMSAQVSNYNTAVTALAATYSATTVDFYNTTIFENWATLSDDGNHPNGAGYDALTALWYAAITGGSSPGGVTFNLTVQKNGAGAGTVSTAGSAAIACGSDCAETYDDGASVTLQATAASGAVFAGWSGACSGTASCNLNMTANRSVTATFNTSGGSSSLPALSGSCTSGSSSVVLSNRRVPAGSTYSCTASASISTSGEFLVETLGNMNLAAPLIRFSPLFRSQRGSTLSARGTAAGGTDPGGDASRLQPADFQYQGAFRLPDAGERPLTFEYGGNAMTFNPDGNAGGPADGFPGSLFITGHNRNDEVPGGGQIAEVSIPVPVTSTNRNALNTAAFAQNFKNVFSGWFAGRYEIPRLGLEYLNQAVTGPKLHAAWGMHQQDDNLGHGYMWLEPNLSGPNVQGPWDIGPLDRYRLSGYIFEIPASWADQHASARYLGTGRYRDGGWSGMGPNLIAYRPWIDGAGTPAAASAQLGQTTLLAYAETQGETQDVTYHSLNDYQHADEWEGGAWITSTTGKSAVLFAGTKATGAKYWYGYASLDGAGSPCVSASDARCWLANGSSCPAADLVVCHGDSERGYWSSRWDAWIILYDPSDLARVAAGEMEAWEPQPYAHLDIDEHLFMNPDHIDILDLGEGDQRRFRIGAAAYDRDHDLLYVLELHADGAKPIVHVWRVR